VGLKVKTLPNYTAPYSQRQQYKTPMQTYDLDQTVQGRLTIKLQVTGDEFSVASGQPKVTKRFLYVDFGGSEMGVDRNKATRPGTASGYFNQSNLRGYYIEKLQYSAWLQRSGDAANPTKASANWSIQSEAPESANQAGSISSNLSYNINGSAGFFGDVVTGGVGGGVTFGTSRNHTINDFTFWQRSDARVLQHEIALTQAQDATPYSSVNDLIDWSSPNVIQTHPNLRELPIQAVSNLPLPGQAVWMNDNPAGLAEKLTLHVMVNATYQIIEGVDGQGSLLLTGPMTFLNPPGALVAAAKALPHYSSTALGGPWTHEIPVDFGVLDT
jgi:hypothetical protein